MTALTTAGLVLVALAAARAAARARRRAAPAARARSLAAGAPAARFEADAPGTRGHPPPNLASAGATIAVEADTSGNRGHPPPNLAPAGGAPGRRPRRGTLLRPPAWVARRLEEAGVGLDPARAWVGWLAVAAGAVAAAVAAGGPAAGVLAAAVAAGAPAVGWRLARHRGDARYEEALPAGVEAVAGALRSGASLRQAVAEAAAAGGGPVAADLAVVAGSVERGATLVDALEQWAARRPAGGVPLAVGALCLAAETGGAAARSVDSVAATLRQRLATRAEAGALATQARLSAAVLAVAPVGFCGLTAAVDRRSTAFLVRTPAGVALLAAGLALDAAGALWMARLTR